MNGRIAYLDMLKVIAIIGVIFIHASAGGDNQEVTIYNHSLVGYFIYNRISRFSVPIFFMISGALFLNPDKKITIGSLYTKYIFRLVCAFVIFSFIYAVWGVCVDNKYSFSCYDDSIKNIIHNTIGGHYHLWFLFAISGLYVLTPLLRLVTMSNYILKYFLVIAFVTVSVIPFVANLLPLHLSGLLGGMFSDIAIDIPKWSLYFVLGYYLHVLERTPSTKCILILLIISLLFMVAGDLWLSIKNSCTLMVFSSYLSPFTVLFSTSIYMIVKRHVSIVPDWICSISLCSFGIYLIHDLFLQCTSIILRNDILRIDYVYLVLIKVAIVFFCSYGFISLIRKIKFMRSIL